jgi:hypothetical protein
VGKGLMVIVLDESVLLPCKGSHKFLSDVHRFDKGYERLDEWIVARARHLACQSRQCCEQ